MTTDPYIASNSEPESKLAIGTVQFGQTYGISNTAGQPPLDEVAEILNEASKNNIDMLDTAPAYGTAESVLGEVLVDGPDFKIVTKSAALRDTQGEVPSDLLKRTFEQSLIRLKKERVYGLIVHLAEDLLGPHGDVVWRSLEQISSEACAEKIGVSCYHVDELRQILGRYPVGLVQVPYNVFDQNLSRSGLLNELSRAGIEVHTRSVFLQGLALMDPGNMPEGFSRAQAPVGRFRDSASNCGLTPLELALGFVTATPGVDRVVAGLTSRAELREIVAAMAVSVPKGLDAEALSVDDKAVITPSMWPPDTEDSWSFDFTARESTDDP